ncbi:MAG: hypothetical protein F6K47_25795 [Symploca sp. SIO2E6]|nr:hypothetical protein [Symploca sp. SIO2E6]
MSEKRGGETIQQTRGRGDAENGNPTQNFAHPNTTPSRVGSRLWSVKL